MEPFPVRPSVQGEPAVSGMLGPIEGEQTDDMNDQDTEPTGEDDEGTEERAEFKPRALGKSPSRAEILEHNRLHMPFRSWCPVCISAKAPDLPHGRRRVGPDEASVRDEVSVDYCFLKDTVGGPTVTVLAGRDRRSGLYVGHAVPFKGCGVEWVSEQLERDLRKMGYYGSVVLKSDQEPALVDLIRDVAKRRGDARTIVETAPRSDSQGNGHAERAVRSIEENVRLQKLALEERLGEKLPITHRAFPWLIEHAVDVLNKLQVGKDGRTAFERLKGKKFRGLLLPFGTTVMARVSGRVQGGLMQERWIEAIALGSRFHTHEHIVARKSDGAVVRARAVRELPTQVTLEALDCIVGEPHAPAGVIQYGKDPRVIDVPRVEVRGLPLDSVSAPEPAFKPRSVRISQEILLKHGYTANCWKCRSLQRGDVQTSGGHSAACRIRMEQLIAGDPIYRAKLETAEGKKTRFLVEEAEKVDEVDGGQDGLRRKDGTNHDSESGPGFAN